MGYFINEIAKITKTPAKVSLSGNPNFIEFSSIKPESTDYIKVTYKVKENFIEANIMTVSFEEIATGILHEFKGTTTQSEISDTVFFVDMNSNKATANNLRRCLMKDPFFGTKFTISPPFTVTEKRVEGKLVSEMTESELITLESKGMGDPYRFKYLEKEKITKKTEEESEEEKNVLILSHVIGLSDLSSSNDSISEGNTNCEIHVDIYKDNGVFLGVDDAPKQAYHNAGSYYQGKSNKYGRYVTTLTKSYYNQPAWFNINAIAGNDNSKKIPTGYRWADAGTMSDIRLIANRYMNGENKTFYLSNIMYLIDGYHRTLEQNELSDYVYDTKDDNVIRPLTNQPDLSHVKGQTQFFNFILSDPNRESRYGSDNYDLGLMYKLYSTSGRPIAKVEAQAQSIGSFNMINSIQLDIDNIIEEYTNTALVEVFLYRTDKEMPISEPLRFRILPHCLHKVNDFAFLNRLGGWSSFSFPANDQTDFKAKATTYYQTHTPDKSTDSEIESVFEKNVTEHFTVQSMPVTREVCEWLKELSASKTVYELRTGRYIIVDDLNIKPNTKDDLFRLDMKYHYSDSFNALTE